MQHSFSEQLHEQMSAFLDGELPAQEIELLLRRLEREPELRATLARYAAIGGGLRGEPDYLSRGFAARVAAAVMAEGNDNDTQIAAASTVRAPAMAASARRLTPSRRRLRTAGGWLAGAGIAATVAGLAIFTLQRQQGDGSPMQLASAAPQIAAEQVLVIGDTAPATSGEALSYTVPALTTSRPLIEGGARLTDYVLAHSEYSSPLGRRNVLSGIIAEDPTPIDISASGMPEGGNRVRQFVQPEL